MANLYACGTGNREANKRDKVLVLMKLHSSGGTEMISIKEKMVPTMSGGDEGKVSVEERE